MAESKTILEKGVWYKNLTHPGSYFKYESTNCEAGEYHVGPGFNQWGDWFHTPDGDWGGKDVYEPASQEEIELLEKRIWPDAPAPSDLERAVELLKRVQANTVSRHLDPTLRNEIDEFLKGK